MSALVQAVRPTVRTVRWWPFAAVALPIAALTLLARSEGRPADAVLLLGAAGLASVLVAAVREDAASTLAALPVSAARRRALRLALVGGPVLLAWVALTALADVDRPGAGTLLALSACGVLVAVRGPQRWAVLAGAAVPAVWFALDRAAAGHGTVGEVLGWWRTDPWPVLALAVAACVLGRRR